MVKKEKNDEIYTPDSIVYIILDSAKYCGERILHKHVIDNSCGNGQILIGVVKRYVKEYLNKYGSCDGLSEDIVKYIHGIDINDLSVNLCINRIVEVLDEYNVHIDKSELDIKCGDTFLIFTEYNHKMDYVLGNPPYIRYHALDNSSRDIIKKFAFCQKGIPDVYIAFFWIGLEMLSDKGILSYITPSSWLTSKSAIYFKEFLIKNKNIVNFVDFKHAQLFDNVMTYTIITTIENNRCFDLFELYRYNEENGKVYLFDNKSYENVFINGNIYLNDEHDNIEIKNIMNVLSEKVVKVKNGLATLLDNFFINDTFQDIESSYVIDVVKSSTGQKKKCLFPYDENNKLIPLETIKENAPLTYAYFKANEEKLKDRTYDKTNGDNWHCIGRTQGLSDTFKHKISINQIIKQKSDIKLVDVKPGQHVYSGLYILTDMSLDSIRNILINDEFVTFIKSLCHYKSGGYYTFSSVELENYLNYKIIYESR